MAEIAGSVLGAISILALFGTVQDGFRLIVSVKEDFPKESNFMLTKLQVEDHRLKMWGRYMGMSDAENCKVFYQQSKPTQALCVAILTEFSTIVTDAKDLQKRYGLEAREAGEIKIDFEDEMLLSVSVKRMQEEIREQQNKTSARKKWRWAIRDQSKFTKLVDKLEYLNDSLRNCLSPFGIEFLNISLPTFVLPTIEDVESLSELQKHSEKGQEILAAGAHLLRTNLETLAAEGFASKLEVKELQIDLFDEFEDESTRTRERSTADYRADASSPVKKRVLIEWRDVRSINASDRNLVENRLRALTCLLMAPKLLEFRILPCIGILDGRWKYPDKLGFVFNFPSERADTEAFPVSLFDLLKQSSEKKYPLGDRFKLAKVLASALALFHASKWLHKGLCSQNILFFRLKDKEWDELPPLDNPYIGGFDYARPDRPEEVSGPRIRIPLQRNVYRHPDVQDEPIQQPVAQESTQSVATPSTESNPVTRYQKVHDIYSLGVILYEIGTWRQVMEKHLNNLRPADVRDLLVESCSELGPLMGIKYERVVRRCLKGDFGLPYNKDGTNDDGKLQRAFWSKVIVELHECFA